MSKHYNKSTWLIIHLVVKIMLKTGLFRSYIRSVASKCRLHSSLQLSHGFAIEKYRLPSKAELLICRKLEFNPFKRLFFVLSFGSGKNHLQP